MNIHFNVLIMIHKKNWSWKKYVCKNTWKFEQSNLKYKWLNFTFLSESIRNFCRHVHVSFPWGRFFWNVWMWQVFTTSLTFFPFHWMNKMQNANWFCIYHLKFDLKVSFNSIFKWNFFPRLHSETVCHTFHTCGMCDR